MLEQQHEKAGHPSRWVNQEVTRGVISVSPKSTMLSCRPQDDESDYGDAQTANERNYRRGEDLRDEIRAIPPGVFGKLSRIKWADVIRLMDCDMSIELYPMLYSIASCHQCKDSR